MVHVCVVFDAFFVIGYLIFEGSDGLHVCLVFEVAFVLVMLSI